jgi:peptide/nickel transport system permease protein
MIAVGVVTVPQYARLVRGQILKIKQQEFVTSAHALGLPHRSIVFRHILPNCLPILIVQSTFSMATAILDAAGLSFLGLGADPSQPEWGVMLSDGINLFLTAPWVLMFTGLAILLVVIGLNLLGDGLRDMLDPKLNRM